MEKVTKSQRAARETLTRISKQDPDYLENPPNRKARRYLETLFRKAGYNDIIEAQRESWKKKKSAPAVPEKPSKEQIKEAVVELNEQIAKDVCPNCSSLMTDSAICSSCGYVNEDE